MLVLEIKKKKFAIKKKTDKALHFIYLEMQKHICLLKVLISTALKRST